jgi:hypothetical protein
MMPEHVALPCVRRPERVISQSEEEGSGRRARAPHGPTPLSPCSFRFTALAGGHFCCPTQLAACFACQVRPSTRLLLVVPDYLLLFFLSFFTAGWLADEYVG